MRLTADPDIVSSFLVWSHTFMEIGHEIISKGRCQLQAKAIRLIVNN